MVATLALVEEAASKAALRGNEAGGSCVAIGEHTVPCSRFHSPLCITSSPQVFPSLPSSSPVRPQRWLFCLGPGWLLVIYSSAAVWGHCGDQLLHISMGGIERCTAANPLINLGPAYHCLPGSQPREAGAEESRHLIHPQVNSLKYTCKRWTLNKNIGKCENRTL